MPFANVNSLIWQVIAFLSQKWLHFIIFLFSFNIREFCHRFWTTSNPLLQTNFSHQWSGGKDPSKKFGKKETGLCGTHPKSENLNGWIFALRKTNPVVKNNSVRQTGESFFNTAVFCNSSPRDGRPSAQWSSE